MARKWYPVIDYLACAECGTCVARCPHGVYDTTKAPSPVVKNPELCVDHCHDCGNCCPVGAITYLGEDTFTGPIKTYTKSYLSLICFSAYFGLSLHPATSIDS
jgi:NAD-dependent dihydropyrimidine dehydrogenase PreA subunit